MIIVAGRVYIDSYDVPAFMTDARSTYPVAAKNPGCIFISFCVHDEAEGVITVLEQWKSQDALDRHLSSPEVVDLFSRWSARMRNAVRKFDAINERDPRD
jgi:quinol monooxygenase YgiN